MDARFGHLEGTGRPRRAVASCPELHAAGIPPGAAIRVRDPPDSESQTGGKNQRLQSFALRHNLTSGRADLADGDDDGLEAESQDRRSGCRRCREDGYIERGVDQEGHEAEDSPEALRAVRARGEEALEVQGVQRLSARSSALSVQGVRRVRNLRARSSAQRVQGVRWVCNLRARSSALQVQGVRWGINLRAWSCALCMQGVRRVTNMRARSCALPLQELWRGCILRARS
jgi:hypothetical protein